MKLTHPIVVRFASLLLGWWVRVWLGTLDIWFRVDDPAVDPLRSRRRYLYLFWHEMMLFPAFAYANRCFTTLVSRHRDGELIAQVLRMLRGRTIRGSTGRGGVAAILRMVRQSGLRHLAVTPDGPRGPRRVVQTGAVYLASRTGMPVVPVGWAFADCWRAGSWDRMAVPRPFRAARCVFGGPIPVPPKLGRTGLEEHRRIVQAAMDEVQARAERLAEAGRVGPPLVSYQRMMDL